MIKLISFFKKNKYFILGLAVLVWVIFVNLFPEGYVFGGGDTNQLVEAKNSLFSFFWDTQGRTGFFYVFFYFLSLAGVSDSIQLSFYLGYLIFGSYLSFWLFSKLIFPKSEDLPRSAVSLFYALNLYTLSFFTGNWGYSYFPSLYVFIPVLIGLFVKFLNSQKISYGFWFCLVLFLGSSGFGNPAFALSFALLLFLLTCIFLYIKKATISKLFLGKIFLIIVFSFLVSASWIFPLAPQMKSGVEGLASSNVIDFETIIRSTSNPISYIFGGMQFNDNNFPFNFYYRNLKSFQNLFILLAFIPVGLVFFGLVSAQKEKNRFLFFSFLIIFLIFVMLIVKVRPPFEISNYLIYHIWGFSTLRGYDKTAIYIPFIMSCLLLITLINIKHKKLVYIFLILALMVPLPFFIGKLQQTAGYRVNSEKDYKKAKMSFLIKIPDEYYSIRKKVNFNDKKSKIATLPATYGDGSGVSYFPKWEFYGVDITRNLYNKKLLDANGAQYNFPGWGYAEDFNDIAPNDESWIIKTLGMMNSQYIIYHKDALEDSVKKTLFKMRALADRGIIKNLEENEYFILYEISSEYFLPYLSWQNENIDLHGNVISIERNFDKIKSNSFGADFREINPKKFVIDVKDHKIGKNIILAETYNPLWKAYTIDSDGKEKEIVNHFKARGYANGWSVENPDDISQIVIEYYPIRLMWKGMIISGLAVLFLIIYLSRHLYVFFKKRKIMYN